PDPCRALFGAHADPAAVLDRERTIREQNPAARASFGEAAGRPCWAVHFGRETPCPPCRAGEVLQEGAPLRWMMERSDPAAPGAPPAVWEVTLIPIRDAAGRVTHLVEILRDATLTLGLERHLIELARGLDLEIARRTAEAEQLAVRARELQMAIERLREEQADLLLTERMAALGRIVAGVAHEIHTPLGAILSTLELVRARLAAGRADGLDEMVDLLQEASERIRKVVQSLRAFSRLDAAPVERVDLEEGIESSLALLAHEMHPRVAALRDYGPLPKVRCRSDEINQVFLNILRNGVQAIRGQGTITVRSFADGSTAVIEIEDTGPGIAAEDRERIFDAGFTTKPRGEGTGWGLAICRRIVREHGGEIVALSEPGRGATFRITLPIEGPS
nr:PAS domain-containing sensor histidine kinase [Acidobacteriota bacterium]